MTPTLVNAPAHVAIIMDGNGRWAKQRGLPRAAGHKAGTDNLRRVIEAAVELGIRILTIYAFSTENWQRPADEVNGLMSIFEEVIDRELGELHRNGVRLRHIGRLDRLSPAFADKVRAAIALTRDNTRLTLNIAFNYGGRAEIVEAVRSIVAAGLPPEQITDDTVAAHLYTAGQPDPDLIIRTSGEMRVSNFLIWQGAYSEYFITPTYWPDFDKEQLRLALEEYSRRHRRFGGL
ncbi:MAG: isoprenyl transferase [Chloroflexi bacterium]|nr:isoprenyl transferase [Chloroflexota bacterium]MBI3176591.1 isoprenyl transferase [Chloroflexota bacterium]MBI5292167.1 isoprenyl transferase [Chloroflexota bacterium]